MVQSNMSCPRTYIAQCPQPELIPGTLASESSPPASFPVSLRPGSICLFLIFCFVIVFTFFVKYKVMLKETAVLLNNICQ